MCFREKKQERRKWLETNNFSTNTKVHVSEIKRQLGKNCKCSKMALKVRGHTGAYSNSWPYVRRVTAGLLWETANMYLKGV